jgi:hypothetical protein
VLAASFGLSASTWVAVVVVVLGCVDQAQCAVFDRAVGAAPMVPASSPPSFATRSSALGREWH